MEESVAIGSEVAVAVAAAATEDSTIASTSTHVLASVSDNASSETSESLQINESNNETIGEQSVGLPSHSSQSVVEPELMDNAVSLPDVVDSVVDEESLPESIHDEEEPVAQALPEPLPQLEDEALIRENTDNARFGEEDDSFAHSIMQILEMPLVEEESDFIQRLDQEVDARMVAAADNMDSDSSDINFSDDEPVRNGNWEISPGHVQAAIRELYERGRRNERIGNTVRDLLNPERYMQRMRRLVFSQDYFRRRNRNDSTSSQSQDHEDGGDARPQDENQTLHEDEEDEPENPIRFDTNLAAEHSYLGNNMSRVSGVNYLEERRKFTLLLFMHQHVLFPGEVLPFMISESVIASSLDDENGLLFGVCFPFISEQPNESNNLYGVTCQIYEKGTDSRGNVVIKSRALQRFVVKTNSLSSSPPFLTGWAHRKVFGLVKILPEVYLPEPLNCIDMGSMHRFRDDASMSHMYKRFQAASTPWPVFIYNSYNIASIVERARKQLSAHEIDTMPEDPVQLSFWLVRNLHLSENMTRAIFTTDSVNVRMKMIEGTLKQDATFTCRYCANSIANCSELFAMSKHGVQTQYCNSAGYIHEINTVYHLVRDAVRHSGEPSADFSWFPGYKWHIIVCKICARHIGWEFTALESNMVPKSFFGISRSTVRISTHAQDPPEVIYRNFMRFVRQDMQ